MKTKIIKTMSTNVLLVGYSGLLSLVLFEVTGYDYNLQALSIGLGLGYLIMTTYDIVKFIKKIEKCVVCKKRKDERFSYSVPLSGGNEAIRMCEPCADYAFNTRSKQIDENLKSIQERDEKIARTWEIHDVKNELVKVQLALREINEKIEREETKDNSAV